MATDDIFNGLGVEVTLPGDENFLKVKETLTRIGIASKQNMTLNQSCHILHKRGRYAILHFKELFILDGKSGRTNFTDEDAQRRNTISALLAEWGLVNLVDDVGEKLSMRSIKIVPYREKAQWNLVSKYTIGNDKNENST
jgi:hypothetical protein